VDYHVCFCVYVEQLLTFSFQVSSGFKQTVSIWYLWRSCQIFTQAIISSGTNHTLTLNDLASVFRWAKQHAL